MDIHPLFGDFGWSRGRDRGVFRFWRGEHIIGDLELVSRFEFRIGAGVTFGARGERDTSLRVYTPVGSAYLSVEGSPLRDRHGGSREVEVKLYADPDLAGPAGLPNLIFRHALWMDPDRGSSDEPRWRRSFTFLTEKLTGEATRTERDIETRVVQIPLPGGASCEAEIRLYESTWTYPRWPWPLVVRLANVKVSQPPAIPGKGENSYDLDDDGICELSCAAHSIEEAAGKYLGSVLRDRQRRAGSWLYPRQEVS